MKATHHIETCASVRHTIGVLEWHKYSNSFMRMGCKYLVINMLHLHCVKTWYKEEKLFLLYCVKMEIEIAYPLMRFVMTMYIHANHSKNPE